MAEQDFFEKLAGMNVDDEFDLDEPIPQSDESKSEDFYDGDEIDDEDVYDEVEGRLLVDVYESQTNIVIEAIAAGVDEDDLDISITPESVNISGKRSKKDKVKKDQYLYQECFWGKFARSIILPEEIDPDKAKASLKNGILKITLPKVHRSKSKKIKVKLD